MHKDSQKQKTVRNSSNQLKQLDYKTSHVVLKMKELNHRVSNKAVNIQTNLYSNQTYRNTNMMICSHQSDANHARVSAVNPLERNPPTTNCKLAFRLAMPQLPMIQSILKVRNQVPPSHFRRSFTCIDVTVEEKRQSLLRFMPTLRMFCESSPRNPCSQIFLH